MEYFNNFERINYNSQEVVNIFDSILMKYREIDNNALYFKYNIQAGEKPEHIAYDIYGNAKLHWILLLTNRIVDPNFDWYLTQWEVEELAKSKYANIYNIHHYIYIGDGTDGVAQQDYDSEPGVEGERLPGDPIRFKYGEWLDSYYVDVELETYKAANSGQLPAFVSPVTNLQYEIDENDDRQEINVISPEHIGDILVNFETMLNDPNLYLTTI